MPQQKSQSWASCGWWRGVPIWTHERVVAQVVHFSMAPDFFFPSLSKNIDKMVGGPKL